MIEERRSVRIRNQQRIEGGHIFFMSFLLLHNVGYEDEDEYRLVIHRFIAFSLFLDEDQD